MPTSSDARRNLIIKWFGSIDPSGPEEFLKSRGYTLTGNSHWIKPTRFHSISEYEKVCLVFLIEEWDYDGISNLIPPV